MKILQIAFVLTVGLAIAQAANIFWGNRTCHDSLLSREYVKYVGVAGQYLNIDVNYPKLGHVGMYIITGVFVNDYYMPQAKAPTTTLVSGGPGYAFVTLRFESQYVQGINSTVEVYGR